MSAGLGTSKKKNCTNMPLRFSDCFWHQTGFRLVSNQLKYYKVINIEQVIDTLGRKNLASRPSVTSKLWCWLVTFLGWPIAVSHHKLRWCLFFLSSVSVNQHMDETHLHLSTSYAYACLTSYRNFFITIISNVFLNKNINRESVIATKYWFNLTRCRNYNTLHVL